MKDASARLTALLTGVLTALMASAETEEDLLARARTIHERVITIDTHVDIPPDFGTEAYDPAKAKPPGQQVDLPGMESGGLDAAFFIVFVTQRERNPAGYARAMADAFVKYSAIRKMTDVDYPDRIGLALTAADVRRIHAEGRRVALIGIENGFSIGRNLGLLDVQYGFGARYLGLVHNGHNDLGDSAVPNLARDESRSEHGGLSELGRAAVRRANELGMMVDVSHCAESTTLDAIKASDGMVGLNFATGFLREDGGWDSDTPLEVMVRHIDYLVERLGETRVGFGSDYDGARVPDAVGDVSKLPNLIAALQDAGYNDDLLRKLSHQNWIRVLRQTWGG